MFWVVLFVVYSFLISAKRLYSASDDFNCLKLTRGADYFEGVQTFTMQTDVSKCSDMRLSTYNSEYFQIIFLDAAGHDAPGVLDGTLDRTEVYYYHQRYTNLNWQSWKFVDFRLVCQQETNQFVTVSGAKLRRTTKNDTDINQYWFSCPFEALGVAENTKKSDTILAALYQICASKDKMHEKVFYKAVKIANAINQYGDQPLNTESLKSMRANCAEKYKLNQESLAKFEVDSAGAADLVSLSLKLSNHNLLEEIFLQDKSLDKKEIMYKAAHIDITGTSYELIKKYIGCENMDSCFEINSKHPFVAATLSGNLEFITASFSDFKSNEELLAVSLIEHLQKNELFNRKVFDFLIKELSIDYYLEILLAAIKVNHVEIIKEMIARDPTITTAKNDNNVTPVRHAILNDRKSLVNLFLSTEKERIFYLKLALETDDEKMFMLFPSLKSSTEYIMKQMAQKKQKIANLLIQNNYDSIESLRDEKGLNVATSAAKNGLTMIIRTLHNLKFNFDALDGTGFTPLIYSIKGINPANNFKQSKYEKIALMLIDEFNVNVTVKSEKGENAICLAFASNSDAVFKALERKGAKNDSCIEIVVKSGQMPFVRSLLTIFQQNTDVESINQVLIECSKVLWLECIKVSIEKYHADTTATDANGKTILMFAAQGGGYEIADYLLQTSKMDCNVADNNGTTPLMLSVASPDNIKTTNLLIKSNAKINMQDSIGMNAFLHAVKAGNMEAMNSLCFIGANVHLKIKGMNALSLAKSNEKVYKFLTDVLHME